MTTITTDAIVLTPEAEAYLARVQGGIDTLDVSWTGEPIKPAAVHTGRILTKRVGATVLGGLREDDDERPDRLATARLRGDGADARTGGRQDPRDARAEVGIRGGDGIDELTGLDVVQSDAAPAGRQHHGKAVGMRPPGGVGDRRRGVAGSGLHLDGRGRDEGRPDHGLEDGARLRAAADGR